MFFSQLHVRVPYTFKNYVQLYNILIIYWNIIETLSKLYANDDFQLFCKDKLIYGNFWIYPQNI